MGAFASLADAVQQEIHRAKPRDAVDQFNAAELFGVEETKLRLVEFVVLADEIVRSQQEAARAARRIANHIDHFAGARLHHVHDRLDQRAGSEVLTRAAFHVLGVLLQESFVGVAFHVGVERGPLLLVDQVRDQAAQLGRVLDLVLRLAKDDADQPGPFAEFLQRVAVMRL